MEMTLSKTERAKHTHSKSFGKFMKHGNGKEHCFDKSISESAQVGETLENNGEKVSSESGELSRSNTDSHTQGQSDKRRRLTGEEETIDFGFKASIESEVEAGVPLIAKAKVKAKASSHFNKENKEWEENETTKENHQTTGRERNQSVKKGFENQDKNGWSAQSSKSRDKTESVASKACATDNSENGSNDKRDQSRSKGKDETVTFTLPQDKDATQNSKDVVKASQSITASNESIVVREGFTLIMTVRHM